MKTIATIFSGGGLIECGAIEAGFKPLWGIECALRSRSLRDREIANYHEINFGTKIICDLAKRGTARSRSKCRFQFAARS